MFLFIESDCMAWYLGTADRTMLPCEFCEELYPEELLIDHQVGCELLEECVQAIGGVIDHMRSWANYFNAPVTGVATIFLNIAWLTYRFEKTALFPLGKSNVHSSRLACSSRSVVTSVHLYWPSCKLVSSHATFWCIEVILKPLQFPGRIKGLFCAWLFLSARCVAIHHVSSTLNNTDPLLLDLVLTWLTGNPPRSEG